MTKSSVCFYYCRLFLVPTNMFADFFTDNVYPVLIISGVGRKNIQHYRISLIEIAYWKRITCKCSRIFFFRKYLHALEFTEYVWTPEENLADLYFSITFRRLRPLRSIGSVFRPLKICSEDFAALKI